MAGEITTLDWVKQHLKWAGESISEAAEEAWEGISHAFTTAREHEVDRYADVLGNKNNSSLRLLGNINWFVTYPFKATGKSIGKGIAALIMTNQTRGSRQREHIYNAIQHLGEGTLGAAALILGARAITVGTTLPVQTIRNAPPAAAAAAVASGLISSQCSKPEQHETTMLIDDTVSAMEYQAPDMQELPPWELDAQCIPDIETEAASPRDIQQETIISPFGESQYLCLNKDKYGGNLLCPSDHFPDCMEIHYIQNEDGSYLPTLDYSVFLDEANQYNTYYLLTNAGLLEAKMIPENGDIIRPGVVAIWSLKIAGSNLLNGSLEVIDSTTASISLLGKNCVDTFNSFNCKEACQDIPQNISPPPSSIRTQYLCLNNKTIYDGKYLCYPDTFPDCMEIHYIQNKDGSYLPTLDYSVFLDEANQYNTYYLLTNAGLLEAKMMPDNADFILPGDVAVWSLKIAGSNLLDGWIRVEGPDYTKHIGNNVFIHLIPAGGYCIDAFSRFNCNKETCQY